MHREGLSEEELRVLNTPTLGRSTPPSTGFNLAQPDSNTVSPAVVKLHSDFAAELSSVLSSFTRTDVDVRLRDQARGTYAQFVFGQAIPTCCGVVVAKTIDVELYVVLQPAILYPLIDQMLGASDPEHVPQRPITEIEQGLAEVIFEAVLSKYEDMWREALSLGLELDRMEHNIQQNRALAGGVVTYQARYAVRFGCFAGLVEFCLPWNATQKVRQRLSAKHI